MTERKKRGGMIMLKGDMPYKEQMENFKRVIAGFSNTKGKQNELR